MTESLVPKSDLIVPAVFVVDVWRAALIRGQATQIFAEALVDKMHPYQFDREGWREIFTRHGKERAYGVLLVEVDRVFSVL